jgi:hypothetical protein
MNDDTMCVTCGEALDRQDRAGPPLKLASAPGANWSERQGCVVDNGPTSLLNPVERYNRAIERRDELLRTRTRR